MHSIIFAAFASMVAAGVLPNNYLPPNQAKSISNGLYGIPAAAFKSSEANAAILRFNNENDGLGSYKFDFETQNGIQRNEQGILKNADTEQAALDVQGSFSYNGENGHPISVQYVANENGFQAFGDHLPTSPPIPEAILKSLEFNAAAARTSVPYPINPTERPNQYLPSFAQKTAPRTSVPIFPIYPTEKPSQYLPPIIQKEAPRTSVPVFPYPTYPIYTTEQPNVYLPPNVQNGGYKY